ncbi:GNAT family N-acetyltransferase [Streptomyces sp. NPDC096153]|uniref:GNAT family N-acetyltransferase n=1 Tax=Streptomyces sp. NPDC096153 TaxID=3155548 RepID=UPI00332479EC
MAVHPAHRHRGIGSRLLAQCLHVAATGGASQVAASPTPTSKAPPGSRPPVASTTATPWPSTTVGPDGSTRQGRLIITLGVRACL